MNSIDQFKPVQLLIPIAHTATGSGVAVNVIPGESPAYDAIAVVSLGAATGSPTSYTVDVTIEESATSGGTYDTIATFDTATGTKKVASKPFTINPAKPYIRATATIAFVSGTSPAIPVDVVALIHESVATSSNEGALA
jgi:hypothetical protein